MAAAPQAVGTGQSDAGTGNVADFTFHVADFPADALRVTGFDGREGISELFAFRVQLCSDDPDIDLDALLGKPCRLEIAAGEQPRYVHGIIRRFELTEDGSSLTYYEAEIVPPAWLLTRRIQSRIFQKPRYDDTSVLGIVAAVFEAAGLADTLSMAATLGEYEQREFTVQYRESDWDFVCRLLEEEGIHFFFSHSETGCTLIVTDDNSMHGLTGGPEVPYRDPNGLVPERDFVFGLRSSREVQIGRVALEDYNFRDPGRELFVEKQGPRFGGLRLYDHPAGYGERQRGDGLATVRLEEQRCAASVSTLSTTHRGLEAGRLFTLVEHPSDRFNGAYLVTHLTHRALQTQSGEQESTGGAGCRYQAEARVIPHSDELIYRPPRVTPRPTVQGSQTAIVVGPKSDEVYVDEYGRVKVRFHWDQEAGYDENASCWIRVSQGWAGGQYGMMFLPRVGQEVIVDFLEGNPDRPIITGRVYNNDHMPPYKLPDHKTVSTIRTCSSKGAKGGNEIRFEDAKGAEQLLLFAERDLHVRAKGSRAETIVGSRHLTVGGDQFELAKKKKHSVVKLDLVEQVHGNKHLRVGGDVKEVVQGKQTRFVNKQYNLLNGDGIWLGSDTSVTLWCNGNFIKLDKSGITIVGKVVNINSGGSASIAMPDSPDTPKQPQQADKIDYGRNFSYTAKPTDQPPPEWESAPGDGGEDPTQTSWIEIELVDELGQPVPNEPYEIITPEGQTLRGTLDAHGLAHVALREPGQCEITFPRLDAAVWERD